MILDEGCAERGCPMHDERETKGVVFIRKEWVGLTDEEIKEIVGPWGDTPITGYTRKLFDQIEAKLKEKTHDRRRIY